MGFGTSVRGSGFGVLEVEALPEQAVDVILRSRSLFWGSSRPSRPVIMADRKLGKYLDAYTCTCYDGIWIQYLRFD